MSSSTVDPTGAPLYWRNKKSDAWIEQNNPHREGTYEYYDFRARYFGDQADRYGRRADKFRLISMACMVVSIAFLAVAMASVA